VRSDRVEISVEIVGTMEGEGFGAVGEGDEFREEGLACACQCEHLFV
jgi:hypothetical protein